MPSAGQRVTDLLTEPTPREVRPGRLSAETVDYLVSAAHDTFRTSPVLTTLPEVASPPLRQRATTTVVP